MIDSSKGDEPGYISRMDTSIFAADINLIDAATDAVEELGLVPNIGRIASGDQFIADLDSKHRIQTLFNLFVAKWKVQLLLRLAT